MLEAIPTGGPTIEWSSPNTWIAVAVSILVVLFLFYLFKPRPSTLLRDDFYARMRDRDDMLGRPRGL